MLTKLTTATAILFLAILPANARGHSTVQVDAFCDARYCGATQVSPVRTSYRSHKRSTKSARHPRAHGVKALAKTQTASTQKYSIGERLTQLLPHPAGCPSRAFCGCGAAVEVFGRPIRELWLARNWFKFPPAAPAPGMVAVRNHHVFVIRRVISPGMVLAYDANSGGRRTRLHLRSLAGYSVRNPQGSAKWAYSG